MNIMERLVARIEQQAGIRARNELDRVKHSITGLIECMNLSHGLSDKQSAAVEELMSAITPEWEQEVLENCIGRAIYNITQSGDRK